MSDTDNAAEQAPPQTGDEEPAVPARPPGTAAGPPVPRSGSDDLFRPLTMIGDDEPEEAVSLVRPYAWTRGRTESKVHLEVETMVSTATRYGSDGTMGLEHQSVAQLCRHPHSVAEVAAKLSVPLGVARVLLSDMAELGLIKVHQTVADDDMAAHLVLMERVLRGLRRI